MTIAEVIIGNLCLASLIGVLACIVGRCGRRAVLAHALWIMFFAKLVTPPIVSVPLPIPSFTTDPAASPVAIASAPQSETRRHSSSGSTPDSAVSRERTGHEAENAGLDRQASDDLVAATAVPAASRPERDVSSARFAWLNSNCLMCLACAIWMGGFLALVVHGILRLVRFRKLIGQCGQEDAEATETVREIVRRESRWRIDRRTPRVVRVSVHVSPMLFGFATRPIIVCPEQLWQSLSPADRKSFLAHETAHFLRRDHWVRWLEWSVSAVYWWFPGVYFAQKQLERHEEACCDARAVKILGTKPRQYAEALLRVVDFISDHQAGLPKFASGMQPTATLEERLRLLMRNELDQSYSHLHTWGSGLACAAIWMVHPDVYSFQLPRDHDRQREVIAERERIAPLPSLESDMPIQEWDEAELPAAPSGFWNATPIRHWGEFSFGVSGYRFTAIAGEGFAIDRSADDPLVFDQRNLTAIAEIPASGRVIIGDAAGNVRLWDLKAGMPVSLLGRHTADVTSLAVTPDGGVYSADSAGAVIRWELQSGRTLARWNGKSQLPDSRPDAVAVQSIRSSIDGQWIAVLCGDWRQTSTPKTLHLLDSQTLTEQASMELAPQTAVVLADPRGDWFAVSWSGSVRPLDDSQPIRQVKKDHVSALILSQHAVLDVNESGDQPSPSIITSR
ncbi:Regulatory protein BlaR1 [Stieleria maiorica]|uniref:Regulatory protein BlaR1 n=1 Tax=Stieleria maiorica TaxID=2795974 RepID=A0A5B9MAI2_9BACT|nr:M56 family metallopeptidase [Stieleria maiorica]QEF96554.1 Regulatory protein BlaR1 [Stieleria maiorica]